MDSVEIILKYFSGLTASQRLQFEKLGELYSDWNEKINVVSRKDIQNLYTHHILHSLSIAKVIAFKPGTKIMDAGTGGGFPGIPLAIMFPTSEFLLVDSIGKKLKVVDDIVLQIGLNNVKTLHGRAENIQEKFDFVVSRAVTDLKEFLFWTRNSFLPASKNELPNGILYLKGGDLRSELAELKKNLRAFPIREYFAEEFFVEKSCVWIRG